MANGGIDVCGVLENGYCSIANRGTEADFWQTPARPSHSWAAAGS